MLSQHTEANIIAFEPAPKNLFALTSTVLQLEPQYRSRVALFPIGAGDVDMSSIIYSKTDNMGHSVVGKPVSDDPTRQNTFLPPEKIEVRRIDGLFNPKIEIALFKLDVEGFECKALAGMGNLLSRVNIMRTEVAPHILRGHGCDTAPLMQQLQTAFPNDVYDHLGVQYSDGGVPLHRAVRIC